MRRSVLKKNQQKRNEITLTKLENPNPKMMTSLLPIYLKIHLK